MPPSMPGMKCSALGWVLPGDGRAEDLVHDQRSRSAEGRPGVGRDQSMNVVWTLLIVAGAVIGVAVARTFWRPLKWPTYAFATWLAVLLMAWPLSATGDGWKEIRVAWYIALVRSRRKNAMSFVAGIPALVRSAPPTSVTGLATRSMYC